MDDTQAEIALSSLWSLTSGPRWPDRWLTVPQMHDQLLELGYWSEHGMEEIARDERLAWLHAALNTPDLETGNAPFFHSGGQYLPDEKYDPERHGADTWTAASDRMHSLLAGDKVATARARFVGRPVSLDSCLLAVGVRLGWIREALKSAPFTDAILTHLEKLEGLGAEFGSPRWFAACNVFTLLVRLEALAVFQDLDEQLYPGELEKAENVALWSQQIGAYLYRCPGATGSVRVPA